MSPSNCRQWQKKFLVVFFLLSGIYHQQLGDLVFRESHHIRTTSAWWTEVRDPLEIAKDCWPMTVLGKKTPIH